MTESRMSATFKLPPFGKFVDALNAAGVETRTAQRILGSRHAERRHRRHVVDRRQRRQRPVLHLASEHNPRRPENGMGSRQSSDGNRSADDLAAPAWQAAPIGGEARAVAEAALTWKWQLRTGDLQKLACGHHASFGRLTRSREEAGAWMTLSHLLARRVTHAPLLIEVAGRSSHRSLPWAKTSA